MLISRKKKFIFFAFNKTGTTSLEEALRPYNSRLWRRLLNYQYANSGHKAIVKHMRPWHLREHLSDDVWNTYYKFCFVRNPFDRFVSLYTYHRQKARLRQPLASELPFEDWLEAGGSGSASRLQKEFVSNDQGDVILDYIGRFENLEHDCKRIFNTLHLPCVLPHRNKTSHQHYSSYYTPRAREIVETNFKDDLDLFGYKYEAE